MANTKKLHQITATEEQLKELVLSRRLASASEINNGLKTLDCIVRWQGGEANEVLYVVTTGNRQTKTVQIETPDLFRAVECYNRF